MPSSAGSPIWEIPTFGQPLSAVRCIDVAREAEIVATLHRGAASTETIARLSLSPGANVVTLTSRGVSLDEAVSFFVMVRSGSQMVTRVARLPWHGAADAASAVIALWWA